MWELEKKINIQINNSRQKSLKNTKYYRVLKEKKSRILKINFYRGSVTWALKDNFVLP